ncbi:hypothetical protein N665_5498s0002 [Sinapis alba]|nr:hypothetical protein N665_5498s0002 [Sinapis alba]
MSSKDFKMFVLLLLLLLNKAVSQGERGEFGFNGYLYDSYGSANPDSNGLLKLTNYTVQKTGQVFYNFPVRFKDSPNSTVSSFSTTFVFAIVSAIPTLSGHGISFAICPTKGLPYSTAAQYLGLFNITNIGDPSNHAVAVEFDTIQSYEFNDMDDNHVGIDINSLISEKAASAGYYKEDGTFKNINLISRKPIQAWVEYDSSRKQLNITLHPLHVAKPKTPLLSLTKDLSPYLLESMYVGFTSSTGSVLSSHYILGWTFKLNGKASDIDPSRLPKLPSDYQQDSRSSFKKILAISLNLTGLAVLIFLTISFLLFLKRKKLMEVLEDWEVQFGPHRFAYKDLYIATKGFKNSELLGKGGFGKVYKDARGNSYLVYDCMPKGSLDKFLYHQPEQSLDWSQRFKIIKDVASGLCYLHQQWVQVIIHRDIKPANILLDETMNAKLGDFGLAKLCDHGIDPHTSNVAGTFGYISPELSRTGKASTSSDVFAFGVFMLEITCGSRPVLPRASSPSEMEQVTMILKLGLLCSHPVAAMRPSMSSVIQFLDGVAQLPHNLLDIVKARENVVATEATAYLAQIEPTGPFTESFASHGL